VSEEFIGSGWAFPLKADASGRIALVDGEREIRESIRLILGTAPGERPMRPEFGCKVHNYVFASPDADTAGRIAYEVRESLLRWEPRIEVEDVTVTVDHEDPTVVYIDVGYSVGDTNDVRNLVFPFYLIPGEA
jgi:uncharacterized protein